MLSYSENTPLIEFTFKYNMLLMHFIETEHVADHPQILIEEILKH